MQIKTTMRYRLTPVKMAVIKETRNNTCWQGCGENGALCSVGGNVNWCSHYGKPYGGSSKNQIELPYGPAISLLGFQLDVISMESVFASCNLTDESLHKPSTGLLLGSCRLTSL
uniref:Uncharacterized protein n=1 Tax=Equus caballus TaxID=9796 RepID=A0A9L0RDU2_HORSE